MEYVALIGPIVSAMGSLIEHIVDAASKGQDITLIKAKIAVFVALTQQIKDADKQEALDVLNEKFPKV